MAHQYVLQREVQFCETDMAGIMHFSNYFYFMEQAEHEFMRSLGFSIAKDARFPELAWPRVHAECTYSHPLKYEDRVEVQLLVREKKPKSLRYEFVFTLAGPGGRQEVARGGVTVVCVAKDASGTMKAVAIPAAIADQIQVAP